jgi:hypothetical protein
MEICLEQLSFFVDAQAPLAAGFNWRLTWLKTRGSGLRPHFVPALAGFLDF